MPKANSLSPEQVDQLISQDIKSRLLSLISAAYDRKAVEQALIDEEQRKRILSCMDWARLILGRQVLELIGMRKTNHGKEARKDDVTIGELGGVEIRESDFTAGEWGCLKEFMTHADKISHLTMDPSRESNATKAVNEAIPIIVKAIKKCLYDRRTEYTFPVPKEYMERYSL